MKTLVAHDRAGVIVGLVVSSPDAPPAAALTGLDHRVTELELAEDELAFTREGDEEQIVEALKALRVDLTSEARLVRDEGSA